MPEGGTIAGARVVLVQPAGRIRVGGPASGRTDVPVRLAAPPSPTPFASHADPVTAVPTMLKKEDGGPENPREEPARAALGRQQ